MASEQEQFVEGLAAALQGCPPITVKLNTAEVCAIIAMIQMACRHPGTKGLQTASIAKGLAVALQDKLADFNPEAGRLLERGWHAVFDITRGTTP